MAISLYGGNEYLSLKWWNFPAGERGLQIVEPDKIRQFNHFKITLDYESDQDLLDMLFLVNAVRGCLSTATLWLYCPYLPHARQDRYTSDGSVFSLKVVAMLINSCNFNEVRVVDPHSSVTQSLIRNLAVVHQSTVLAQFVNALNLSGKVAIIAPDKGAVQKATILGEKLRIPVMYAEKIRDASTGKILATSIPDNIMAFDCAIVIDDICDGGATFLGIAKALDDLGFEGHRTLMVTHGIFSKGRKELELAYNSVLCFNSLEK